MSKRIGLLGAAGVLAAAGLVAAQKPPGLPVNPHVECREPAPAVRALRLPEAPPPAPGAAHVAGYRPVSPVVELFAEVHELLLNWLTIPLGTVSVGD
jgi:hypothetical protein